MATVTDLRPASSPSSWSRISVPNLWRCPQRRYMRRSISAQSVASVPPAPAVIVRIAFCSSYGPANSSARAHPVEVGLDCGVILIQAGRHLGIVLSGREFAEFAQFVGALIRGSATSRSRRAAPQPYAERTALRAGRTRSRARLPRRRARAGARLWRLGQRRPEVAWIRSARSRKRATSIQAATVTPRARLVVTGGRRSLSRIGRSSMMRSAVLLRATTGLTHGQYPLCGQTPQLPSQSSVIA